MTVRFTLQPGAIQPRYQSEGASGMDLHALLPAGPTRIWPGGRLLVKTGVALELPPGYEAQIRPRSGLALNHGIIAVWGTIDSDFRDGMSVILMNCSDTAFEVKPGDRIAQFVIAKCEHVELELAEELSETVRGSAGFGSTGSGADKAGGQ